MTTDTGECLATLLKTIVILLDLIEYSMNLLYHLYITFRKQNFWKMPTEITEYCVALSYTTFSVISRNFVIFLFLVPGINPDDFGIYGGEDEEKTPLNATDTPR